MTTNPYYPEETTGELVSVRQSPVRRIKIDFSDAESDIPQSEWTSGELVSVRTLAPRQSIELQPVADETVLEVTLQIDQNVTGSLAYQHATKLIAIMLHSFPDLRLQYNPVTSSQIENQVTMRFQAQGVLTPATLNDWQTNIEKVIAEAPGTHLVTLRRVLESIQAN
jgi:hypothetical protein